MIYLRFELAHHIILIYFFIKINFVMMSFQKIDRDK